jgi:hypothetical protein
VAGDPVVCEGCSNHEGGRILADLEWDQQLFVWRTVCRLLFCVKCRTFLDIHTIPARKDEPEHLHYDVRYAFQADRHAELIVSRESRQLAWVALNEIQSLTAEESILRMVRKTPELALG